MLLLYTEFPDLDTPYKMQLIQLFHEKKNQPEPRHITNSQHT